MIEISFEMIIPSIAISPNQHNALPVPQGIEKDSDISLEKKNRKK